MKITKEQVITDIELCKSKIKEALDYDVYSVLPLYVAILEKLNKELNSFGLEYTVVEKGVQQNAKLPIAESDIKAGDVIEFEKPFQHNRFLVTKTDFQSIVFEWTFYSAGENTPSMQLYKDMPFKKVTK